MESEGIERELEIEDGYYVFPLASLTMTIMRTACEHIEAIADRPLRFRIEED